MPGIQVDGFDFFAVHDAAGEAIERARSGGGPTLLEVKFGRFYGHHEGDSQTYRGDGEAAALRAQSDCLTIFRSRVTEAGLLDHGDLDAVDDEVATLIDESVALGQGGARPTDADLTTDVYVSY